MKKSKEQTKVVNIVLTESLHEELLKLSEKTQWNVSMLVRSILKEFFEENKDI